MTGIQFVNLGEVLAGTEKRKKKLDDLPKLAHQMGAIAVAEIKQLDANILHVDTGNFRNTIHAEVKEAGSYQHELWVGSRGAFTGVSDAISSAKSEGKMTKTFKKNVRSAQKSGAGTGYNYGAKQERLYHPIEIGWNRAQGKMTDLWNEKMKGIVTANEFMSDFSGLDVSQW